MLNWFINCFNWKLWLHFLTLLYLARAVYGRDCFKSSAIYFQHIKNKCKEKETWFHRYKIDWSFLWLAKIPSQTSRAKIMKCSDIHLLKTARDLLNKCFLFLILFFKRWYFAPSFVLNKWKNQSGPWTWISPTFL